MLTNVLLIAAGGEIDLRYCPRAKRLRAHCAGEDPGAVASLRKHLMWSDEPAWVSHNGQELRVILSREYEVTGHPLPPPTPREVAEYCASANEKAIVITCELGLALEYAKLIAWKNLDKVIMVTGSDTPAFMPESNAEINLGFALAAAQLYPRHGVYIAYRGEVHIWSQCRRIVSGFFTPEGSETIAVAA